MKVHKLKVFNRWGGEMRGSLCGRLNLACEDGMNVSEDDADVTCRFCLRDMEITKRLRVAAKRRAFALIKPDHGPALELEEVDALRREHRARRED